MNRNTVVKKLNGNWMNCNDMKRKFKSIWIIIIINRWK